MNGRDDFTGDMPRFPFDDRDADAVFGAGSGWDSVPDEFRDVADLVRVARRAGSADELIGEDVIVAQIAASVGEHVSSLSDANERTSVLTKLRTAKLAAATTAMVVLGATAAAAATGTLASPSHHDARLTVAHAASAPRTEVAPLHTSEHQAQHHRRHGKYMKHGLVGEVASINGVSDPNTCGTAGGGGSFTITARHDKTFIVNVDTATEFRDEAVADPSFANVCVGGLVAVKGHAEDTTVTAKKVVVLPPPEHKAFGTVASVNGVSDPNTCGTAGATGSFTLTAHEGDPVTVNVDPATEFKAKDVTDPSFANVCVGSFVGAKGTATDNVLAARKVFIAPVKQDDPADDQEHEHDKVFGEVASVNGASDPNTCGTAGAAGSFTLTSWKGETVTVNVDASTQFFGDSDPSFADICVGGKVGAKGDATDTTVAATDVFALRSHDSSEHKHGRNHRGDCDKDHNGTDPEVRRTKSFHGDNDSHHDGDHSDWGGSKHHDNDYRNS